MVSSKSSGLAPRTWAASGMESGIALKLGSTLRITKGSATSVWEIGMISHEERRLSGGSSSATAKPNPSVTALVASGSINSGSAMRDRRPPR